MSAGGTREPIDPVRYVGNRSSGRMGWAVAEAARRRGAQVTVLASNVDLPRHPDVRYVDAPDRRRPARAPPSQAFPACDVLVMAAAVADFRPGRGPWREDRQVAPRAAWHLDLEPTADILADLAGPPGAPGGRRLRGRARRGGPRARPRQADPQAPRPDRPQRRLGRRDRLRLAPTTRSRSSARTARRPLPRMSKEACAERILDAVAAAPARSARPGRGGFARGPRWSTLDALGHHPDTPPLRDDELAPGRRARRRAGRRLRARRARAAREPRGVRHRAPVGRPRDDRGRPRGGEDGARQEPRPRRGLRLLAPPVHRRPAAVRRHRHHGLGPERGARSSSGPARSSPTSCWSTRSTAPRRRPSRRSSSAWRRGR